MAIASHHVSFLTAGQELTLPLLSSCAVYTLFRCPPERLSSDLAFCQINTRARSCEAREVQGARCKGATHPTVRPTLTVTLTWLRAGRRRQCNGTTPPTPTSAEGGLSFSQGLVLSSVAATSSAFALLCPAGPSPGSEHRCAILQASHLPWALMSSARLAETAMIAVW